MKGRASGKEIRSEKRSGSRRYLPPLLLNSIWCCSNNPSMCGPTLFHLLTTYLVPTKLSIDRDAPYLTFPDFILCNLQQNLYTSPQTLSILPQPLSPFPIQQRNRLRTPFIPALHPCPRRPQIQEQGSRLLRFPSLLFTLTQVPSFPYNTVQSLPLLIFPFQKYCFPPG
jgi:hypothetical protein